MTSLLLFLYLAGFGLTFCSLVFLLLEDIRAHWKFGVVFMVRQMGGDLFAAWIMSLAWPVFAQYLLWRIIRA